MNNNSELDKNSKSIHFFTSLNEMEEVNYKWLASLTAEQHLQNAVVHIKQIFAEELKRNPNLGAQLIFEK